MKKTPREVAMGLATQAELLPKLRDKMLDLVDQINVVLQDGKTKRTAPKPKATKRYTNGRPRAKFLDAMPLNAVKIPGVEDRYRFSQGLGMLSVHPTTGKIQLMRLPKTNTWNLRDSSGNRVFLTKKRLQEALGADHIEVA